MTGKEICEAYIRHINPVLPEEDVRTAAQHFWNGNVNGDRGSLAHVFAARQILEDAGKIPREAGTSDG